MEAKKFETVTFDEYALDRISAEVMQRGDRIIACNAEYEVDVTDLAQLRMLGFPMTDIEMEIGGALNGNSDHLPPQVVNDIIVEKLEERAPGRSREYGLTPSEPTEHELDMKDLARAVRDVQSLLARFKAGPRKDAFTASYMESVNLNLMAARNQWGYVCRLNDAKTGRFQPRQRVLRSRSGG